VVVQPIFMIVGRAQCGFAPGAASLQPGAASGSQNDVLPYSMIDDVSYGARFCELVTVLNG
jgi:hypothetical protein